MIGLYLMTEKGYKVLESILAHFPSNVISYVVCSKDNSLQKDYHAEIQILCKSHNILFIDRKELCDYPAVKYRIAISWRWLIKEDNSKLIVLHDSLLPKYRGFNPLVTSLINGDQEIGVTAIWASEEMDSGNIIASRSCKIEYPIKIFEAIKKIIKCYCDIVHIVVNYIYQGDELPSVSQKEEDISYSLWRDDEDYEIDWTKSSYEIKRFVDSVGYPYAGANFTLYNEKITVLETDIYEDVFIVNRTPGKIFRLINGKPCVVCGKGLIVLLVMEDKNGNPFEINKVRIRLR